jgi:hypothetical protein
MRSIAARVGLSVAVLLLAAGPAAAHEMTPTTTPTTTPAAMGVVPVVAATTTGPEAATGGNAAAGLAVAMAVTAVAVRAIRRRTAGLDRVAAAALVFAGVAHLALAPSHWAEGRLLGAFFFASGMLLVGQAGVVALRPSPAAYASVLASTAVLVLLYFLAREVTLPLVDHRDPYLLEDVPVKVAEGVAALVAGLSLVRVRAARPAPALAMSSTRAVGLVTSA